MLSVAERRSKTPAQIILRYLVQLGMVVIPKSSKRDRIVENFSIFDFVLDPEDMASLGGLDKVNIRRTLDRVLPKVGLYRDTVSVESASRAFLDLVSVFKDAFMGVDRC